MSVNWTSFLKQLAEPFDPPDIKWRVGSTSRDKTKAQALPYAEPRMYEDRLNSVCPGAWSVTFKPWSDNRVICELTIHGITRSSTGEGDGRPDAVKGTAAEAQAFKRACSKFGVGRYLYNLNAPWVAYDPQRKRLLETPKLPVTATQQPGNARTLSKPRAAALHRELGRLPYIHSNEHNDLASEAANRPIESFTQLTEQDARRLYARAKRVNAERAASVNDSDVSDKDAAILK